MHAALLMATLVILSGGWSGCGCVPKHESFASPRDTLLTFQSAFQRDDPETEFRCLSPDLRRRITYPGYSTFRDRVIAENRTVAFVLDWNDLSDNIVSQHVAPDENHAVLTVQVYGRTVRFQFARELYVVLQLSPFELGGLTETRESSFSGASPDEAFQILEGGILQATLERFELTPDEQHRLRGWRLEERWKFSELKPIETISS
ncbi:MAG: hypothetical protein AB1486_06615 [Planctomycetota bacterium]